MLVFPAGYLHSSLQLAEEKQNDYEEVKQAFHGHFVGMSFMNKPSLNNDVRKSANLLRTLSLPCAC